MNTRKPSFIIYFIAITILATIAIQVYWNSKNYTINKQRLINDVQIAFDNGVEAYYADLAKSDVITFIDSRNTTNYKDVKSATHFINRVTNSTAFLKFDSISKEIETKPDSVKFKISSIKIDSSKNFDKIDPGNIANITILKGQNAADSISGLKALTNRIVFSITRDSIQFDTLSKLLNAEFKRKDISMNFALAHLSKNDSLLGSFNNVEDAQYKLVTFSKSTYLPRNEQLKIFFPNLSLLALKKGLTGILLSLLLSASIIACLLYLLKIINKQKQLAEIKNDLISNITHEFKTPIATVSTALEGIEKFNADDDKEKTKKYLGISNQQLKKLHLMVEKLLETSTLDSDKLLLNTEPVDVVSMLNNLVEKHQMITPEKHLIFKSNIKTHSVEVDLFHFENAVSNLIDNAIKYGGDTIEININSVLDAVEITVADNGGSIEKGYRDKIFDKFYRIPTGNQHDVKGFGIGLYYSKKIIEKHGGTIQLIPDTKYTLFKIKL